MFQNACLCQKWLVFNLSIQNTFQFPFGVILGGWSRTNRHHCVNIKINKISLKLRLLKQLFLCTAKVSIARRNGNVLTNPDLFGSTPFDQQPSPFEVRMCAHYMCPTPFAHWFFFKIIQNRERRKNFYDPRNCVIYFISIYFAFNANHVTCNTGILYLELLQL